MVSDLNLAVKIFGQFDGFLGGVDKDGNVIVVTSDGRFYFNPTENKKQAEVLARAYGFQVDENDEDYCEKVCDLVMTSGDSGLVAGEFLNWFFEGRK